MTRDVVINPNRNFKGVWIPEEIYRDISLSWNEKIILIEVIWLSKSGDCFANNQHFANLLGISKKRVETLISNLRNKGYISSTVIYKPNSKQVEKRIIKMEKEYSFYDDESTTYPQKQGEVIQTNEDRTTLESKGENNPLITYPNEKSNNLDNKECISETETHYTDEELSEIEENAGQWHWKSQKQYVDYIEKIMPKYVQEIAQEDYGKNSQSAYNVMVEFTKMFFSKYRKYNGNLHPWYKKETLRKCFNTSIAFFINIYSKANMEIFTDYIEQFYEHDSMRNKPLAVFCTFDMLDLLRKEIEQDWSDELPF